MKQNRKEAQSPRAIREMEIKNRMRECSTASSWQKLRSGQYWEVRTGLQTGVE